MYNYYENEERRPSVLAANALFLLAAVGLVFVSLFSGNILNVFYSLFPGISVETAALMLNGLYYLLAILLPVCVYARRGQYGAQAFRLNPISFRASAALVVTALIGVMLVLEITALWSIILEMLGCNTNYGQQIIPETTNGLLIYMAASCMLPGICEELLFRGVVLSAWERRGGIKAIVITTLMFTVLHGSVQGLPAELIIGVVISYLVMACDSVYAGMIYHTVHNSAAMILAFLSAKILSAEQMAAQTETLAYSIVDIISLVFSIGLHGALFTMLLLMFRRRMKRHGIVPTPDTGVKMSGNERALLFTGIAAAAILYIIDILFLTNILN